MKLVRWKTSQGIEKKAVGNLKTGNDGFFHLRPKDGGDGYYVISPESIMEAREVEVPLESSMLSSSMKEHDKR